MSDIRIPSLDDATRVVQECLGKNKEKPAGEVAKCIVDGFKEGPKFEIGGSIEWKPLPKVSPFWDDDKSLQWGKEFGYIMPQDDFLDLVGERLSKAGINGREKLDFIERFESLYVQIQKGALPEREPGPFSLGACYCLGVSCFAVNGLAGALDTEKIITRIIDDAIKEYKGDKAGHRGFGVGWSVSASYGYIVDDSDASLRKKLKMTIAVEHARERAASLQEYVREMEECKDLKRKMDPCLHLDLGNYYLRSCGDEFSTFFEVLF